MGPIQYLLTIISLFVFLHLCRSDYGGPMRVSHKSFKEWDSGNICTKRIISSQLRQICGDIAGGTYVETSRCDTKEIVMDTTITARIAICKYSQLSTICIAKGSTYQKALVFDFVDNKCINGREKNFDLPVPRSGFLGGLVDFFKSICG